tara:strand:+ start:125 stop:598 length:474 start_codon:yes stop_codon:yes gene_type:complete
VPPITTPQNEPLTTPNNTPNNTPLDTTFDTTFDTPLDTPFNTPITLTKPKTLKLALSTLIGDMGQTRDLIKNNDKDIQDLYIARKKMMSAFLLENKFKIKKLHYGYSLVGDVFIASRECSSDEEKDALRHMVNLKAEEINDFCNNNSEEVLSSVRLN